MTAKACLVALALLLVGATTASAAIRGIQILTGLTTQTGTLTFRANAMTSVCNVTITKQMVQNLVPVMPGVLTRIGQVTSWIVNNPLDCALRILNLPTTLGGFPPPSGPLPGSWDISYLTSDPLTNDLYFGILGVQLSPFVGTACLYQGTLLGAIRNNGALLTFNSTLPSLAGNCVDVTVSGTLFDNPAIQYVLLNI
ncbi:hypothetical protein Q5424_06585 [Conexibacter sp. JD483]|uniref:hypothetical protein n=1 Tax=unclassified Conexibacter TaxID=2627773 RepID=UPI00271A25FA|nr:MULTISPECIES: hypothetical protein [unclassified Conexibacter]MDO8185326.1 hypothetical protein [Conexibacter sp. CPCC 205706]MDO8198498.1 hypothetical protein [Conexibacter sp. CPCC 205762]MDR9368737.1 hypothetical protein [Conexibacter sp. JD483]